MILKIFLFIKLAFLTQKQCKNWIMTLVFKKNAIFCRKLAQIAEISDHKISRILSKLPMYLANE
jgi:hypothetical protein